MFQFPWYASIHLCIQCYGTRLLHRVGFPIRTSPDQSLLTAPRGHIVVRHVLLRLLAPRHPPCALCNLTNRSHFVLVVSLVCVTSDFSELPQAKSHADPETLAFRFKYQDTLDVLPSFRYPVFKEQIIHSQQIEDLHLRKHSLRADNYLSMVPNRLATTSCCQNSRPLPNEGLHLQNRT